MTFVQPLLLRADASTLMGAGHVMRCLALAQAWQDAGGAAHFVAAEVPDGLATRLAAEGVMLHRLDVGPGSTEDALETGALATKLAAAWVVEDGYHFGAQYQRTIKDAGLRLLAIDDYGHAGHYVADLVLNQNIYAAESIYPNREAYTQLLLGTQYVLLRREFLGWRGWQREIPDVARKVLVTMGGGDPENVTSTVIDALDQVQIDGLEVVVVVGAGNPHLSILHERVERSTHIIRLERNTANMSRLMAWADLAVTGVGSTCWELLFMGLAFIGVVLVENQRHAATMLSALGLTKQLDRMSLIDVRDEVSVFGQLIADYAWRLRVSRLGPREVDGLGPSRVLHYLENEHHIGSIEGNNSNDKHP